jgi:hypothetical protein
MQTIVIATTPNNASAATMEITAIDAFISEPSEGDYFLKISATRLQNETFSIDYT